MGDLYKDLSAQKPEVGRRIFLLHCVYSDSGRYKTLVRLNNTISTSSKNSDLIYVCIDNLSEYSNCFKEFPVTFVSGTNALFEFSAWKEGWDLIKHEIGDHDILILTNDTIVDNQPYAYCLELVLRSAIKKCINFYTSVPYIVGIQESLSTNVIDKYLTSFMLIMNGSAGKLLMPEIEIPCIKARLSNSITDASLVSSPDLRYDHLITDWLTIRSSKSWYKAQPIDAKNYENLKAKANSILLEHSISVRAKFKGVDMIDIFAFTDMLSFRKIYLILFRFMALKKYYVRQFFSKFERS